MVIDQLLVNMVVYLFVLNFFCQSPRLLLLGIDATWMEGQAGGVTHLIETKTVLLLFFTREGGTAFQLDVSIKAATNILLSR